MPIYEYRCAACKKDHEIIQKFSDPLLTICPACGGNLEKKLSLSAFQLKGSGWYKDGYATPAPKKEGQKGAKEASSTKEASKGAEGAKKEAPKPEAKK